MGNGSSIPVSSILKDCQKYLKEPIPFINEQQFVVNQHDQFLIHQIIRENHQEIVSFFLKYSTRLIELISNITLPFSIEIQNIVVILCAIYPYIAKELQENDINQLIIVLLDTIPIPSPLDQLLLLCLSTKIYHLPDNEFQMLIPSELYLLMNDCLKGNEMSIIFFSLILHSPKTQQFFINEFPLSSTVIYSSLLENPLTIIKLPLFIELLFIKPCPPTLLLNHFKYFNDYQLHTNIIMALLQGLLLNSQTNSIIWPDQFDLLLNFILPPFPAALTETTCGVLYNASLFTCNLSATSSNTLVSALLYVSQPNILMSTSWRLFSNISKIIHRLLHNRNDNVLFALLNSLEQLKDITTLNISSLHQPEAIKEWSNEEFNEYMKESKIQLIIDHCKQIFPKIEEISKISPNALAKTLVSCSMSDEIITDQLKIEKKGVLEWVWTIWYKEIKKKYKDLYQIDNKR
ncbi:Uncharacterized protein QTN25_009669 [Entamoeba marina]